MPLIVIFTIAILTYAYIRLSSKMDVSHEIGDRQMEVITQIQEGEKAMIFLDFAAQMAIYEAVYSLQSQGGISKTTECGTYYGFNRWNSDKGKTCFVDSSTAKDSLRDLFVSNLVSRVAKYPSADFVGNVPTAAFARGLAISAQQTVTAPSTAPSTGAAEKCTGTSEFQKDFTYESSTGYFPPSGSRVWLPAEANCKGSYPLIVWLHGCQKTTTAQSHIRFGDGHKQDIIPIARKLIKDGTVMPVILAAPSQTKGTSTYYGVQNSACGGSLWGSSFDISKFIKLVESNLPDGITISSVGVVGHSGAGCSTVGGIHAAAKQISNAVAIGQFDTCTASAYGSSLKQNLGANTKFIAIYSAMGGKRADQNSVMGITKKMECPKTGISGGDMGECYSDSGGNYFGFTLKVNDHGLAVSVGAEQFLKLFYPAKSAAPASASGTPSASPAPAAGAAASAG